MKADILSWVKVFSSPAAKVTYELSSRWSSEILIYHAVQLQRNPKPNEQTHSDTSEVHRSIVLLDVERTCGDLAVKDSVVLEDPDFVGAGVDDRSSDLEVVQTGHVLGGRESDRHGSRQSESGSESSEEEARDHPESK